MGRLSERYDKRYLGRKGAYILIALAAIAVMVFAGYMLIEKFSPGLELADASVEKVVITVEADAYIFRDEKPLYSSTGSGSVCTLVRNGGRVYRGEMVAEVYSASSPESVRSELEEQIAILEKGSGDDRSVQSARSVDEDIYSTVLEISRAAAGGNYLGIQYLKTEFLVDMKKREIYTGAVTDYRSEIDKLKNEQSAVKARLGSKLASVYTDTAGYFFAEYDGYGGIFSTDRLEDMTYSSFRELTEAGPEQAGAGVCVGSVVSGYRWYIAAEVGSVSGISEGRTYNVYFPYSGTELGMKLERIIADSAGERFVLVMSTGSMPDNFDYTRSQPVRISTVEYSGFRIPKTAIRVVSGTEGVFVKERVAVVFRRINVIYEGEDFVICNGEHADDDVVLSESGDEYGWIRQNDIIVVGGTELYDGKVVG